jgi:hypothetical protein
MSDAPRNALIVPRPNGGELSLDMTSVYQAVTRIQEIQIVNSHKAPELLAIFNMAYLTLSDHLRKVELVYNDWDKTARRIRAKVILDKVPAILREKGLASSRSPGGSEDQREAILDTDDEYVAARDKVQFARCMTELLKGRRDSIEMAYSSVKKILGSETQSQGLNNNRNLSAGDLGSDSRFGGTY